MKRERIEQVIRAIKDADRYDESISEPQSTTALTAVQDALPLLEEMLAEADQAATLPASAAEAIIKARKHHVEEETLTRLADAERKLAEALNENRQLRDQLDNVRAALDEPVETLIELARRTRPGW